MARGIQTYLGAILFVFIAVEGWLVISIPQIEPICNAGTVNCASFSPPRPAVHLPIITFIQSLPLLTAALLAASLLACGIGYLLLYRNRALVAGVILAYAPFIALLVIGFLSLHLYY